MSPDALLRRARELHHAVAARFDQHRINVETECELQAHGAGRIAARVFGHETPAFEQRYLAIERALRETGRD
jgi:hypothetical protein